jgi:hypothetical protein
MASPPRPSRARAVNNVQTRPLFLARQRKAKRIDTLARLSWPVPTFDAAAGRSCASIREKPVNSITFCELF